MPIEAYFRKMINGRLRETSFTAITAADVEELVELLSEDTTDDAHIYHTERRSPSGKPDHLLTVGIRNHNHGAMSFLDSKFVQFFSKGDTPEFEPFYNEREFPPYCEVGKDVIKKALVEFFETGTRPTSIKWQSEEL
ncbi:MULTISPECIES: Imm1 family immunity protein [Saccharopolyspora]|uniref:Immunity protein Imm1 n=1 Tax=Saccharopolyspora elongata TaxID=2530387 RepID=A0A4R4Z0P6_9PSEU|nr:Imm1 family immunity protein [Saccharopolyspora elongata]TDD49592.1 hypothetical protein E1288_18930 [Saccharopolyspora elongata]